MSITPYQIYSIVVESALCLITAAGGITLCQVMDEWAEKLRRNKKNKKKARP